MIGGLIGEAVVVAMQAHPLDRAALAGQGAHDHEYTLHPNRHHQAPVGHQTVQTQGDPQHGHPIKNAESHNALPAPEPRQQSNGGENMHHHHEAGGAHLQLALTGRQRLSRCHDCCPLAKLTGISCLRGNQTDSPGNDKAAQTGKPRSGWCR